MLENPQRKRRAFPEPLRGLSSLLLAAALAAPAAAAEWTPARAPIPTRWAAKVDPRAPHPEHPRPQMERAEWLNLNGLWQLEIASEKGPPPAGKELALKILVPFPVESSLSGVGRQAERLWYRRTFEVPAAWAGKRIFLRFGAVDWEAEAFVNGVAVGSHRGGYDAFDFDITAALKPSGPQEIIVRVYDPTDAGDQPRGKQVRKPGGIFYTPATGIWQTVWLEAVPEAHVAGLRMAPDADRGLLRLRVEASEAGRSLEVRAVARDGARGVGAARGAPGAEIELAVERARLWSPEDPHLYDLEVELVDRGAVVDRVRSYFGLRKVEVRPVDGVPRILLNGKAVFQMGFLDQGFWPDGVYTAPTDEALRYDIEMTKKLGMNMIRKHVKVEPERWYAWADRLGILVWQDMPSGNNATPEAKRQFEVELEEMVRERGNHPSVILWVVFNEGWGQFDTERLVENVKRLDPTRLVSNASGWTDRKVGDVIDIHAYPGPAAPPVEPRRAAVLGEFGGLGLKIDGHTWEEKTWGYQGMADRDHLTRRYVQLLSRVWGLAREAGLCSAVYTQTTDVETECNGLLTYDREILKPDLEAVARANRGDVPVYIVDEIVPTSRKEGLEWRYALEAPPEGWTLPGFDDSRWKVGRGGFGTRGTPGAIVRTEWRTGEIWLRRHFDWETAPEGNLAFLAHHDEDVEVYLNGVLAARATGYTTDYEELPMTAEGRAALKRGKNLIAVRCRQTAGGQYIDVGIARIREERRGGEGPGPGTKKE